MTRCVRLSVSVAALLFLVSQRGVSFAKVQFAGSLVAVTAHSVWVREANGVLRFARLPDQGSLSAPTLAGRHKIGDQVLVKSVTIELSRDDEENEWYNLEATSVDYLRPASDSELASALRSPARNRKGNLLRAPVTNDPSTNPDRPSGISLNTLQLPDPGVAAPDKNDPAVIVEESRALTQKYLAALPNFNADETSKMYGSPDTNPPKWQLQETLLSEVSFRGFRESHRNVVRNGERWNDLFEHLPPAPRAGPQHGLLRNVMDANCAKLEFARRAVEAGVAVLIYRISAQAESCFGGSWGRMGQGERYFPGQSGEIAIAEADRLIRRLDIASTGYPKGYGAQLTETHATWDYVKIGEERHLLPIEVKTLQVHGGDVLSVSTFKNHRHFEAFTNITYK